MGEAVVRMLVSPCHSAEVVVRRYPTRTLTIGPASNIGSPAGFVASQSKVRPMSVAKPCSEAIVTTPLAFVALILNEFMPRQKLRYSLAHFDCQATHLPDIHIF